MSDWGIYMTGNKKKVVVTGSEGLLGKVICNDLSGYQLIKLDLSLGHDLSDTDFVNNFFTKEKNIYGLVNLFSINPQPEDESEDIYSLTKNSIREYIEINTISLFHVCQQFAKRNKLGSIINFSSIYGVVSPKHFIYAENFTKHIGYTISKSSVLGMSKYLSTILAPDIRVNTIIPGGVYNNQDKSFVDNYSSMTPMKRLMHKKEIITAVEYFLDENSSYTTGAELHIDGGWTSW